MIVLHTASGERVVDPLAPEAARLPDGTAWIDLVKPGDGEIALVERLTGIALPAVEQLEEVEASSRLRRSGQALYLSAPVVFRDENRLARVSPVGLVLTADYLVTIRYEEMRAFTTCQERVERQEFAKPSPPGIFVALLDAIVDRLADLLEGIGTELDNLSEEVFSAHAAVDPNGSPMRRNRKMLLTLRRIGHARQLASKVRATLLAVGRIVPYVHSEGQDWISDDARSRLDWVGQDVSSLDEFETHLSDKISFLLDADLGLINVEQNDLFRVLTIVSVVGIPPTLFASLYGMNFKHMPELDWAYGYPYGLAVITLSAVVPLVYFKVKGWF